MSYVVPIDVPIGRNRMQPTINLLYQSNNGNSYIGMGWQLELGAIERAQKGGINYTGDDYVLRMDGAAIDLINIGGEYRAKIENTFYRFKKLTASDGKNYWKLRIRKELSCIQQNLGQHTRIWAIVMTT